MANAAISWCEEATEPGDRAESPVRPTQPTSGHSNEGQNSSPPALSFPQGATHTQPSTSCNTPSPLPPSPAGLLSLMGGYSPLFGQNSGLLFSLWLSWGPSFKDNSLGWASAWCFKGWSLCGGALRCQRVPPGPAHTGKAANQLPGQGKTHRVPKPSSGTLGYPHYQDGIVVVPLTLHMPHTALPPAHTQREGK